MMFRALDTGEVGTVTDMLTMDDLIDVPPAERAQIAAHFGVCPSEVAATVVTAVVDAPAPLYLPDSWVLTAA